MLLDFSICRTGRKLLKIFFVLICLITCMKSRQRERNLIAGIKMCRLKPLVISKIEDPRCHIEGKLPVIYGCMGYCRSSTLSLTDRLGFIPTCHCCQPTMQATVNATLVCRYSGITQRIRIMTALRCYCRKCR